MKFTGRCFFNEIFLQRNGVLSLKLSFKTQKSSQQNVIQWLEFSHINVLATSIGLIQLLLR